VSLNPPAEIAEAFAGLPENHREALVRLRTLIFEVADELGAAPVTEVLRWGQPSYLAAKPRQSTAIRLWSTNDHEFFGVFFHCQTSIIPEFRNLFPGDFRFDGNRGILFRPGEDPQAERLRVAIGHALQYRLATKR